MQNTLNVVIEERLAPNRVIMNKHLFGQVVPGFG